MGGGVKQYSQEYDSPPDNLHTWIIGDGYIVNPKDDPYYIGEVTKGYYKNTDIGYLRVYILFRNYRTFGIFYLHRYVGRSMYYPSV